jgi:hypothetical protein
MVLQPIVTILKKRAWMGQSGIDTTTSSAQKQAD